MGWRQTAVVFLVLMAVCTTDIATTDTSAVEETSTTQATTSPVSPTTSTAVPDGATTTAEGDVSLPSGRDVEVERIIDGDTIVVTGGERVRLIGIDTPEVGEDECYAREATNFLASLVPPDTGVRLVADVGEIDQYGRTLAYLYRTGDGLFVNAEMVAEGYAVLLTIPPNVGHADEFQTLAEEAREDELGLWSACLDESTSTTVAGESGKPVVISAVNFDAPGNDNGNLNGEWVRLKHQGSGPLGLGGWRLEDEGPNHVYHFPAAFSLGPGAEVTIYTGCGTDSEVELYWCKSGSAVWNNSGDTASLFDDTGALVDSRAG